MSFKVRWNWWRSRRLKHPPDDIHRAGELAEMRLCKLSRAAGRENGWKIYESVRIPDPDGGRREIDMVVIGGNTMLVVEQKHWAGSFVINDEHHFIQNRNNGTQHNHDGVADRIARKARILTALHDKRLEPPAKSHTEEPLEVDVIVAMTHQRLEWPEIPDSLAAKMVDEAGFIKILENTAPGDMNPDLVETLEGFNTWDEVHLHGGLMLKGDVYALGLNEQLRSWFATRNEKVEAIATHERSLFSLFSNNPSQVTLKTGGKNIVAKIPYGLKLEMHVVGEKSPRKVDWANITHINVSKPPASWAKNI
ncbi:MAG: NERD domain-containing protein [Candidatus Poseidoniales archaeon]|nr:MAG: NERD domain-containing protein [Candidatus Poseidoniales archaeon]